MSTFEAKTDHFNFHIIVESIALLLYRFASKKRIVNGEYFVDYIYVRITAK